MKELTYFKPNHPVWESFFEILATYHTRRFPISISGPKGAGKRFCADLLCQKLGIPETRKFVINALPRLREVIENDLSDWCIILNETDAALSPEESGEAAEMVENAYDRGIIIRLSREGLEEQLRSQTIGLDLFYLFGIHHLPLPSLNEMKASVPAAAQFFLNKETQRLGIRNTTMDEKQSAQLKSRIWENNFDELQFLIRKSLASSISGEFQLCLDHLPTKRKILEKTETSIPLERPNLVTAVNFEEAVNDFKKRLVLETIRKTGGNKSKAAKLLGMSKAYIFRLINMFEIETD